MGFSERTGAGSRRHSRIEATRSEGKSKREQTTGQAQRGQEQSKQGEAQQSKQGQAQQPSKNQQREQRTGQAPQTTQSVPIPSRTVGAFATTTNKSSPNRSRRQSANRWRGDGGAPHAEHLSEKLLCQRDDIAVNAIVRLQQPSAKPGFEGMQRIARERLLDLRKQDIVVAHDEIANGLALGGGRMKLGGRDPR